MNGTVLILWLLMDAAIVYGSKEIRKCKTEKILSGEDVCPSSAICTELNTDPKDVVCMCKNNSLTFNPNYTNDSDYCIFALTDGGNSISNSNSNTNSNSKTNSDDRTNDRSSNSDDNNPLPGAKHVAVGIFFPIISVVILIGGIFAYKKLHITQRIRNFRRNRRSRPFYGDVSLEEDLRRAAPNVYYVDDTVELAT